jgi:hypothetical protein
VKEEYFVSSANITTKIQSKVDYNDYLRINDIMFYSIKIKPIGRKVYTQLNSKGGDKKIILYK